MAIDFQIVQSTLAQIMTDWVQRDLANRCQPKVPGGFVDHLDVVSGDTTLSAAGGRLLVRIPVQVHLVTEAAVMAAPNSKPVINNVGRVVVEVVLVADGTALKIESGSHDLSGLALSAIGKPFVMSLIDGFLSAASKEPVMDFGPRFTELGIPLPAQSRIEQGFGVIAVRFDPAGPLSRHLGLNMDWGLFLDGPAVVSLLAAKMTNFPVQPQMTWAPNGDVPRVNFSMRQSVRKKIPVNLFGWDTDIVLHADVTVWGNARFSLSPGPMLRTDLEWDVDIDSDDLGFVTEYIAEEFFEDGVRNRVRTGLLAAIEGETPTGPTSLFLTRPLKPFTVLEAQMRWSKLGANAAGMTLGGTTQRHEASWGIPSFAAEQFGSPFWLGRCRELARAGDGTPPQTFTPWQVDVAAGVSYKGATFCEAQVLAPNEGLQLLLKNDETEGSVGIWMKGGQAGVIQAPVRFVLRTSRGVRLVDLGMPEIEVDGDGYVRNVNVIYLRDCLYLSGALLKLSIGEKLTKEDFKTPPVDGPDWATQIGARFGFKAQLVRIEGLEPLEIVRFETPYHRLTLLADERGGLRIPALVPLGAVVPAATVSRRYNRAFPRTIEVETRDFRWLATTEAGEANWLRDARGTPRIMREGRGGRELTAFLATEGFVSLDAADDGINPQPLPPGSPSELRELVRAAGIADFEAVNAFPGFEDEPIAIVSLRGNDRLVVERDGAGNARISGRWEGPLAPLQIDGDFAMAVSGSDLLLFSIERVRETLRR